MALTVILAITAAFITVSAVSLVLKGSALDRPLVYGASLALCAVGLAIGMRALIGQAPVETMILPLGPPWIGAHFRLDALSAFFLVVVNLGGGAACRYPIGFARHHMAPPRA